MSEGNQVLSAPQRCNAERCDAQRNFFTSQLFIPPFLQRHRCDALPRFSASPVIILTSCTSPFRLCFHFSFHHNGLLYKTTRNYQESQRSDVILSIEKAPTSYRAISGPSGPKSQKSQKRVKKRVSWALRSQGLKSPKRVKQESKTSQKVSFLTRF